MKIGFTKTQKINSIFPDNDSPANLKTCWHVSIPALEDAIDSIQVDNKYVLSVGHHATHEKMLFSKKFVADYDIILKIENVISYLLDSPCYICFPKNDNDRKKYFKGLAKFIKKMGINTNEYFTLDHYLENKFVSIAENTNDDFMRMFPFDSSLLKTDQYVSCSLPNDEKLQMAFIVYKQGLLSPDPIGGILNFWRVLEAVTTVSQRIKLIKDINTSSLLPVYCAPRVSNFRSKKFNLMAKYKKFVRNYVKKLLEKYENYEDLMRHYYKTRRCASAHANDDVLSIDKNLSLETLYKDSILIKYLARFAIERYWVKLKNT